MPTFYHHATCLQTPFFKELDTNGRPMYVFNLQIEKEVSSAVYIDELATYLQAQGVATVGTDLFKFNLTPTPDAQLALVPYTGLPAEQAFGNDALKWEHPRVQVVSRGPIGDHRSAFTKADAAYKAFAKIAAESLA